MKFAETITDIPNAFQMSALNVGAELDVFYCKDTMKVRTGDEYTSPIDDIFKACQIPSERNSFLLLGHRGCGKSTELNKMSVDLRNKGYYVRTINCFHELDLPNLRHTDLMILMGEALIEIADEIGCSLEDKIKNQIIDFWTTSTEIVTTDTNAYSLSGEVGAQVKVTLASLLHVFLNLKADLKHNHEKRETCRATVINRTSEWLRILNSVSDKITEQSGNGRQPVIIFEDLDKIDEVVAWNVFSNYSASLTGVAFPVIYTFPIALSYDPRFTALSGYFNIERLPMIQLKNLDGSLFKDGIDMMTRIVSMRAMNELFDEHVLEMMIIKTGGSLRDLFYVITTASKRAINRNADTISIEDVERALIVLKNNLTRLIEYKHEKFLVSIYNGNHRKIKNKELLLEMLQGNVVLEYNGKEWHDLHPLITEFLEEQRLVKRGRI